MPDPDNTAAIPPGATATVEGAGALLFAAGEDGPDPIGRFMREDVPGLDWRQDFLRSPAMDRLFEATDGTVDDGEEEEFVYYKSELVTTGELQNIEDTGGM